MAKKDYLSLEGLGTLVDEIKAYIAGFLSGKADTNHTHKYAGSSTAGGSATSAVKLDTASAGSATQPVYFADGKPVKTTYTLGKSVPSDAKFTDTTYSAAGSSLGLVKSGGDVSISSGVITVNDDSHNHTIANVDNLQSSLDAKVPTSRTVNGKALSGNITLSASDVGADASGSANTALTSAKSYTDTVASGKASIANGQYTVTTAGTGSAYTATVPSITALTAGVSFIMIPHVVSASTAPTLNVNSLGAKNIKRRLSNLSTSLQDGYSNTWLAKGKPFRVVYDGTAWIVEGHEKPVAADMYGLSASITELNYCDGVTSSIQTQLDSKLSGTYGTEVPTTAPSTGNGSVYFFTDELTPVAVTEGGTGATNAATALANLGVADYIVEQGTSGIWTYRKWASGIAECWGEHTETISHYSNNVPNFFGYYGTIQFPFTFAELPVVNYNTRVGSGFAMPGSNNLGLTTSSTNWYALATVSGKLPCVVHIQVKGRWK